MPGRTSLMTLAFDEDVGVRWFAAAVTTVPLRMRVFIGRLSELEDVSSTQRRRDAEISAEKTKRLV